MPISPPTLESRAVVPSGQTYARTYPVHAIWDGNLTYPPSYDKADDHNHDELLYSYGSFAKDSFIMSNYNWRLCVGVPVPSNCNNPMLLALNYMIKYATNCNTENSVIQTDVLLTTKTLPEDVVTVNIADLGVYKNKSGYGPYMVDHEAALCLSSTIAIKFAGKGRNWSYFVDNQQITPKVRVANSNVAKLYLVFHVSQYDPNTQFRNVSLEVSAAWQKEEVEKKAKEQAQRKMKEELDKKAKKDAEKRARWEEERQARAEERQAREEERRAREEESEWGCDFR